MTKPQKSRIQKDALANSKINSSYTVFFLLTALGWAKVFSGYFPESLRTHAVILIAGIPLILFVFRFFLNQFENIKIVLNLVVAYFCLTAIIVVISAIKGPLADGTIPVIQFQIFGSRLFTGSTPAYVTATVFGFYAAVTLFCTIISAAVLEGAYGFLNRFLPGKIRRPLLLIDRRADQISVTETTRLFIQKERYGVVATVIVLLGYAALYVGLTVT